MSLRRRAALLTSAMMVVTVLVVLVLARQQTAGALLSAIDDDLLELAEIAERSMAMGGPGPGASLRELRGHAQRPGGPGGVRRGPASLAVDGPVQYLDAEGTPLPGQDGAGLPVSEAAAAVARHSAPAPPAPLFEQVEVSGEPLRLLTVPLSSGGGVQLARSLVEFDRARTTLTTRLLVLGGAVTAAAGGLAVLVAGRITGPIVSLTTTAERIARTQQLEAPLDLTGDDEVARLARAFDAMLTRLDQARQAQTQLIADASHELRTPLTSLRTNIDLLRSGVTLPPEDHRQLLVDLDEQLTRFGSLVDDLLALARGEAALTRVEELALEELVEEVAAAARRDHPGARIATVVDTATPPRIRGDRERLHRGLRAVVDNAVLHGGGDVEVVVSDTGDGGRVGVRDRGDGFGDRDRERALERFYRGRAAHERPGSGLGLAIVAQAAHAHGGTVELADAPSGGAVVTITLPREPTNPTAARRP